MPAASRAVLISPTTPFLLKTADNPHGVDGAVFETMIAAMHEDSPRLTAELAAPFFGIGLPNVAVSPELVKWGVNLALQASPRAVVEMTRNFADGDFRPDMAAFSMPTLVIDVRADQTIPFAQCGQGTADLILAAS